MKQKLEISSLIDSYKDFLIYEKGLSENTVNAYISDINKVSGQEEYFDIAPPHKGSKKKLKIPEAGEGRKSNCTDIKHFKIIALRKN